MLDGGGVHDVLEKKRVITADAILSSRVVLIDFGECYDADLPANPARHAREQLAVPKSPTTPSVSSLAVPASSSSSSAAAAARWSAGITRCWKASPADLVPLESQGLGGAQQYMAPEAWDVHVPGGDKLTLNYEHTDIYALGMTLLEMTNATTTNWTETKLVHQSVAAHTATLASRGLDKTPLYVLVLKMVKSLLVERISARDAYADIMNMCTTCYNLIRPLSPPHTP